MRKKTIFFTIIVILSSFLMPTWASLPTESKLRDAITEKEGKNKWEERKASREFKFLDLTPEQKAEIKALRESYRKEMKDLRAQHRESIRSVFTAEQLEALDAKKRKMRQQWKDRERSPRKQRVPSEIWGQYNDRGSLDTVPDRGMRVNTQSEVKTWARIKNLFE